VTTNYDGSDDNDEGRMEDERLLRPLQQDEIEALREMQGTELNFIGFGKLLALWSNLTQNQL